MENLETQKSPERKEKPPFLYHGSPHKNIEAIESRRERNRDPELQRARIRKSKTRSQYQRI